MIIANIQISRVLFAFTPETTGGISTQNYRDTEIIIVCFVVRRDDQKPLRLGKKKKNIFGCRSVKAAACEKTPRRSQKGQKSVA